eukprot:m.195147 g.195147  ORF g.195147 m.195147 type:complete len:285 (-) comp15224_c0_seq3:387-1241(-)
MSSSAGSRREKYRPSPLSLRSQSAGSAGPLPLIAEAGVAVPLTTADVAGAMPSESGVLLVRALPRCVFDDPAAADRFKERLAEFGTVETCELLPEFSAARVRYSEEAIAEKAADELRFTPYLGSTLDCITGARLNLTSPERDLGGGNASAGPAKEMDRLQVPTLEKQWLISPPPSPPPGWKPRVEDPPVINLALVEALQGLDPKAERELHPAAGGLPAITVQLAECSDDEEEQATMKDGRKIPYMSMPPPWARDGPTRGAPWSGVKPDQAKTSRPPPRTKTATR